MARLNMESAYLRLEPEAARSALGKGLENLPDYEDAIHDFDYLASRLGEWQLLLDLVNGFLRHKVDSEYCTVRDAILRANKALDKKGLVYFDVNRSDDRNDALARTIEICLELLLPEERERYIELVELPEDADIHLQTICRLWERTGGMDESGAEALISKLEGLSLLPGFDATNRTVRIDDVIHHYLTVQKIILNTRERRHPCLLD